MRLVSFEVNGRPAQVTCDDTETLHGALRSLHLFSVREACGLGICGSCTVVLDGRIVSSCLVLAGACEGSIVETAESLATGTALHPIQEAFVEHAAFQCSYCTPGFLLSTKALLEENTSPTADEVRRYLAGNLCRCGSYLKIEEAVLAAAERLR
jgi:aerobic-type carbon monoxide dehydrogenase small subunit (CoxS/CutS family)